MVVIDFPNIHEKLVVGDKILIDYGGVIMTVVGFEKEEIYLKKRILKKSDAHSVHSEEKKTKAERTGNFATTSTLA